MFAQHHTFDDNVPLSCFNRSGGFFIAKIAPFQLMGAASAAHSMHHSFCFFVTVTLW